MKRQRWLRSSCTAAVWVSGCSLASQCFCLHRSVAPLQELQLTPILGHRGPNLASPVNGLRRASRDWNKKSSSRSSKQEVDKASGGELRAVGSLLGGAAFWAIVYVLFFKGTAVLTRAVEAYPKLEFLSFLLLSLIPVGLVQKGLVSWGVDKPLLALADCAPTFFLKHLVKSAIGPLHSIMQGLLLFFAVNLLAQSAPASFAVQLPEKFIALDPNGDGLLTGGEIESVVQKFSVKLLTVLINLQAGIFGVKLLQQPKNHSAEAEHVMDRYWRGVDGRRITQVCVFLVLNGAVILSSASACLTSLGFEPRSIFALGSISGLAFGLASQNLVGNFMSGLLLIVNGNFTVGDVITTNGFTGKVLKMGWSVVTLDTGKDEVIFPNSAVVNSPTTKIGTGSAPSTA